MGCGAAEATGLGFVCFVVISPRVLSANRVDLGFFFCFTNFPILPPPPPGFASPPARPAGAKKFAGPPPGARPAAAMVGGGG